MIALTFTISVFKSPRGIIEMLKKWLSGFLAITLFSIILAGCAGGDTSEGGSGNDKVTVTLWHNWTGQDAKAVAMRKII